jgi:transposase-like protein
VDRQFLEECLSQEMSLERIGALSGKHPSTVSYWLRKYGLAAVGAKYAPKGGLARDELEVLVNRGLTIEQIAQHLGVGDRTVGKWLRRFDLQTDRAKRRAALNAMPGSSQDVMEFQCPTHGLTRFVAIRSERRLRCAKCRAEAVARRRRKVKEMLVAEAGGRCVLCGYSRSSVALQFHHLDPATKSFGLGVRGITRALARLRAEASKCVLLCANCHAEVEAGVTTLPLKFARSTSVQAEALASG